MPYPINLWLLVQMRVVRKLCAVAHKLRQEAGIPLRQIIPSFKVSQGLVDQFYLEAIDEELCRIDRHDAGSRHR